MSPYRNTPLVARRSRLWRFRVWLARLIAPANDDAFLDRLDISDGAKDLALAIERGWIRSVEWHPRCSNCGTPAPIDMPCRECWSRERRVQDQAHELRRRIADMNHLLGYLERRIAERDAKPGVAAGGSSLTPHEWLTWPIPPKMPKAPPP